MPVILQDMPMSALTVVWGWLIRMRYGQLARTWAHSEVMAGREEAAMSGEVNSKIVERFETAFGANDVDTIDELCAPDLVDHNPIPDQKPGLAGFKDTIAMYKGIFPDSQVDVQHIVAEGDLVATHWTVTGTHQAEFFGIPATGRKVSIEGMNVYRLDGGRITDVWTQFDGLGLMQQLGAMPG